MVCTRPVLQNAEESYQFLAGCKDGLPGTPQRQFPTRTKFLKSLGHVYLESKANLVRQLRNAFHDLPWRQTANSQAGHASSCCGTALPRFKQAPSPPAEGQGIWPVVLGSHLHINPHSM